MDDPRFYQKFKAYGLASGILKLRVRFDRPMHAMVAERVALDGHAGG